MQRQITKLFQGIYRNQLKQLYKQQQQSIQRYVQFSTQQQINNQKQDRQYRQILSNISKVESHQLLEILAAFKQQEHGQQLKSKDEIFLKAEQIILRDIDFLQLQEVYMYAYIFRENKRGSRQFFGALAQRYVNVIQDYGAIMSNLGAFINTPAYLMSDEETLNKQVYQIYDQGIEKILEGQFFKDNVGTQHIAMILYIYSRSSAVNMKFTENVNDLADKKWKKLLFHFNVNIQNSTLDDLALSCFSLGKIEVPPQYISWGILDMRIRELFYEITPTQSFQIFSVFTQYDKGTNELWDQYAEYVLGALSLMDIKDLCEITLLFGNTKRGSDSFWEAIQNQIIQRKSEITPNSAVDLVDAFKQIDSIRWTVNDLIENILEQQYSQLSMYQLFYLIATSPDNNAKLDYAITQKSIEIYNGIQDHEKQYLYELLREHNKLNPQILEVYKVQAENSVKYQYSTREESDDYSGEQDPTQQSNDYGDTTNTAEQQVSNARNDQFQTQKQARNYKQRSQVFDRGNR